jgi:hypothetical protein
MESKPTAVDAAAEVIVETLKTPVPLPIAIKDPSPSTITTVTVEPTVEPTVEIATPAISNISNDVWKQVTQLWDEYFGEGKKSNLTIAIIVITTIPLLIAASALLDFLNKLPLLPSVFELVGFGYSGWFVYRYLLLANTRKELTEAIATWKNKVFG